MFGYNNYAIVAISRSAAHISDRTDSLLMERAFPGESMQPFSMCLIQLLYPGETVIGSLYPSLSYYTPPPVPRSLSLSLSLVLFFSLFISRTLSLSLSLSPFLSVSLSLSPLYPSGVASHCSGSDGVVHILLVEHSGPAGKSYLGVRLQLSLSHSLSPMLGHHTVSRHHIFFSFLLIP